MRAVVIRERAESGAASAVVDVVDDWPEPEPPGHGEVLLETECSALNHMDLWVARGVPGLSLEYPRISGVDACARVVGAGPGVEPSWVGRRVLFNAACVVPSSDRPDDPPGVSSTPAYELIGEHTHGAHRERFVVPVDNLAPVGDLDPTLAAATGVTFVTAYSMMITKAELRPGQTVLITGIGGGVSTAALSLARWMACRVAVTSRHAPKLERARELGAELTILDQGKPWSKEVWSWTHKRGVDLVVDTVGEATYGECIRALARGGAYVSAGATSGRQGDTDLARLFWNQLRILGSTMGSHDEMRQVAALLRAGRIAPEIDRVYPWHEAPRAWERLERGEQMGKIVLRWTDD